MIAFPSSCRLQVFQLPFYVTCLQLTSIWLFGRGQKVLVPLVGQCLLVSTSQRPKGVVYLGEIIHTTLLIETSNIWKAEILERKTKQFAHQIRIWKLNWIYFLVENSFTLQKQSQILSSPCTSLVTSSDFLVSLLPAERITGSLAQDRKTY